MVETCKDAGHGVPCSLLPRSRALKLKGHGNRHGTETHRNQELFEDAGLTTYCRAHCYPIVVRTTSAQKGASRACVLGTATAHPVMKIAVTPAKNTTQLCS